MIDLRFGVLIKYACGCAMIFIDGKEFRT